VAQADAFGRLAARRKTRGTLRGSNRSIGRKIVLERFVRACGFDIRNFRAMARVQARIPVASASHWIASFTERGAIQLFNP
jgi:hypothetical protein